MMSDPAFPRLAALHSPDQAQGYLFLAGILYARGIEDLDSLDRIVTGIAQLELLPLTVQDVIRRFVLSDSEPASGMAYTDGMPQPATEEADA